MRVPTSPKFSAGMFAFVMGLAAVIAPAPARAATKLTSAYTAISGVFGGQWAAQEAGIFARYGIDSSLVYIASATKAAQAMLAGEVPIAVMGGEAVVSAALGGANLVFVAGVLNRSLYFIVVRQDILSPQDLRGKAIGVTRYGATSDFSARLALRHWRLEPNKDVALLQLGGVPEILAAMKSGAVQGGTMTPPTNVRARHQGYRELVNVKPWRIEWFQRDLENIAVRKLHSGSPVSVLHWRCERRLAGVAGLEPVTSAVTGQRSNQLSYAPAMGTRT